VRNFNLCSTDKQKYKMEVNGLKRKFLVFIAILATMLLLLINGGVVFAFDPNIQPDPQADNTAWAYADADYLYAQANAEATGDAVADADAETNGPHDYADAGSWHDANAIALADAEDHSSSGNSATAESMAASDSISDAFANAESEVDHDSYGDAYTTAWAEAYNGGEADAEADAEERGIHGISTADASAIADGIGADAHADAEAYIAERSMGVAYSNADAVASNGSFADAESGAYIGGGGTNEVVSAETQTQGSSGAVYSEATANASGGGYADANAETGLFNGATGSNFAYSYANSTGGWADSNAEATTIGSGTPDPGFDYDYDYGWDNPDNYGVAVALVYVTPDGSVYSFAYTDAAPGYVADATAVFNSGNPVIANAFVGLAP
jgi:hypothetical protein